jgi:glycolate oxidase
MDIKRIVADLRKIVGEDYATDDPVDLLGYTRDFGGEPPHWPDIVVKPGSVEETSEIMRLANRNLVPVTIRGGGSSTSGGCLSAQGGIVLETLRMNRIIEIDEDCMTVTVEPGVTFGKLESELDKHSWMVGVNPEGGLPGTVIGNISIPGVGFFSSQYGCQGDQVLGLRVVLPTGENLYTGSRGFPNEGKQFWRYVYGPDLSGIFIGSEGTLGIIAEATLKIYRTPEHRDFEKLSFDNLDNAARTSHEITLKRLAMYNLITHESFYRAINPEATSFPKATVDIFLGGTEGEVKERRRTIREITQRNHGASLGSEEPRKYWENHFIRAGATYKHGVGPMVTYMIPYSRFKEFTEATWTIMQKHKIKKCWISAFDMGNCLEHYNGPFYYEYDQEEYRKVRNAMKEMMDTSLKMGGTPYRIGLQWAPHVTEALKETQFYQTTKALKMLFDPNNILNRGVLGL